MHKVVSDFLENQKRIRDERRASKLIKLGLYEKAYGQGDDYDQVEYDESANLYRHYKIVPITLSDEEYEEVLKSVESNKPGGSNISIALTVIAIFSYIGGILGGFIVMENIIAFICLVISGVVTGTVFLGFSKIIDLLDDIKNKIN